MVARAAREIDSLFVSYSPLLGGAERILLDVAEGTIACPPGPLAAAARARGLDVLPLSERSLDLRATARDRAMAPLRLTAHAYELRRLLRRSRPRLVVAWGMRAAIALAPLGRFVFQHNDLLPGPLVAAAVRGAARRAEGVVALSHAIAADLDPRGGLGVRVAHPGVDLSRFVAGGATREPRVISLGALVPWKRQDLALEALARALAGRDDLTLTLAGTPIDAAGARLLERLRARASRPDLAGRVTFAGQVESPAALAGATCLLHCADREPFGMALVEALACGAPVVAPSSGGPMEIVDEHCGRLFAAGDAESAAAALLDVVARAESLRAACRTRAERHFSLEAARTRWWDVVSASGGEGP